MVMENLVLNEAVMQLLVYGHNKLLSAGFLCMCMLGY